MYHVEITSHEYTETVRQLLVDNKFPWKVTGVQDGVCYCSETFDEQQNIYRTIMNSKWLHSIKDAHVIMWNN